MAVDRDLMAWNSWNPWNLRSGWEHCGVLIRMRAMGEVSPMLVPAIFTEIESRWRNQPNQ